MKYHCNNTHELSAFHSDIACECLYVVINKGLHIHSCVFSLCRCLPFLLNGLANTPELNCTDGRDNAGQSHAVTVARKVGSNWLSVQQMCLGFHEQ